MKSKIIIVAIITALVMAGGYLERGWVDFPGTATLLTLGAPMLITWIHEGNEARSSRRRRARR